ncbi:DUF4252 domain-containing protein [uncultured Maribacter sp.]|uniref:DUF4252 domain-containing protein n=1 Tax=uncultured Maribacter sp. TaxID=431308 RepID=UPI00260A10EC|nr:DUF4252 domain-containing protein [uncultured Maribacter sp.]
MITIIKKTLVLGFFLVLGACSSTQSLQEYYVDNYENPNFISFDVPASVLNLEEVDLSATQKEAVSSLKKLNILAFKKTPENVEDYTAEKLKVKAILKNKKYTELMKVNTSFGKGTITYLGDDDAIDEVIVYGDNKEKGFALIRVLGNNMNPAHLVELIKAMEKSNYKGEGLGKLKELLE